MSPAVTFWTGTWDPAKEAISKEIRALRTGDRAGAPVVAISPANRLAYRDGVLTLPARAWPLLRVAAAAIERRGHVTHVFGGTSSWHQLRALGRRPILMTAVVPGGDDEHPPVGRIAHVVVESDESVDAWIRLGIPRDRISRIRPGVDLALFERMAPPAVDRFTLLFASTPSDPSEIGPRGIPPLIELARALPEVDLLVPWRVWGDEAALRRAVASLNPPSNVHVTWENAGDMRAWFARAHATIACFNAGAGKVTPNFVIEGLACGRPCLLSDAVGASADIERLGGGLRVPPTVEALREGVASLRTDWRVWSARAREAAQAEFDLVKFRARYDALYHAISGL